MSQRKTPLNPIIIIEDIQDSKLECFSMPKSTDLNFNMVRVTAENKENWEFFAKGNTKGNSKVGIYGFLPALEYYNNQDTEVWVAFISNEPATDAYKIDFDSVEMFVTVTTSKNSLFTSHMGITRAAETFPKSLFHKNISMKLHSFAARFMKDHYAEKLYMINNPAETMREILLDTFKKHKALDKVFIGDNHTDHLPNARYSETKNQLSLFKPSKSANASYMADYYTKRLELDLIKQRKMISRKAKKESPITIEYLNEGNVFNFIIKDSNEEMVSTITPGEQEGELAWFFMHPYQIKHCASPIITSDLDALASLEFTPGSTLAGDTLDIDYVADM